MSDFRPRLTEAATAAARMDALGEFLVFWLGPRKQEYGEPAAALAEHKLPMPLEWLYDFAGRWPRHDDEDAGPFCVPAFSHQDGLYALNRLETTEEGRLIFMEENQSVWNCRTLPEGDDPPVWCYGDHVDKDGNWFTGEELVTDSLSKFLVTFLLQELTFGSRVSLRDDGLTAQFEAENATAVPVWIHGPYAQSDGRSFHLWGDVLVMNQFGDLVFAANHPEGIAVLKRNQGAVHQLEISAWPALSLEVKADGSARVRYKNEGIDESAEAPAGSFDLAQLAADLEARTTSKGHYEKNATVSVYRKGQTPRVATNLHDGSYARSLFTQALGRAGKKNEALERRLASEWPF